MNGGFSILATGATLSGPSSLVRSEASLLSGAGVQGRLNANSSIKSGKSQGHYWDMASVSRHYCMWLTIRGRFLFSFVRRLPLPRGDEGPPQVGGQALDKARGRKPRNEARPFSRGVALWAFERRPIAQVRDEHGAAPGAACCVKPLRAFGGMGDVPAARLMTRMPVAGAAGLDQARPNGCWR